MSEQFWQRLNQITGIICIGVIFGITAFLASLEIKDLDLWLHLKMGKYISQDLHVPGHDVLSATIAGKPWVNHEWLFQVVIYQVWKFFDFNGLINMQIGVVFLTLMILLLIGYSKERQFLTAFALLAIVFVYQSRFTIRPDIFSLLFFASFMWILSWFLNQRWSMWALVLIQVIWTNMHGFFFFGPLLVLIALMSEFLKRHLPLPWQWNQMGRLNDEEYKRLALTLPVVILACCANPLTFKGAFYPISVLLHMGQGESKVFFDHITELAKPITTETIWTAKNGFYKIMIMITALSLIFNRRRIDISSLFLWIIFLVFSLAAIRNMVFFAVAAFMVFMANVSTIDWKNIIPIRFTHQKFKYISAICLKVLLICWVINTGTKIANNGYFDYDTFERKSEFWDVSKRSYPYHAVDFLVRNDIKGNFFNDFNSGAYLIGRCYPNIKVFIDGRTEVYGSKYFEHYQKIWKQGDTKVFLEDALKFNITGAFLNNNNQQIPPKVLKMFYALPNWKIVYLDYDAVIFLKETPLNRAIIDKYGIDLNKWKAPAFDLQKVSTKRLEPIPLVNRAYILKTLGFNDLALKLANQALKVSPDNPDAFEILAKVYDAKKDHWRSFESWRVAVVLRPRDTDLRLNLAKSCERLKDYQGARFQYERVIELNSSNAKAFFGLARIYALEGNKSKALEYLTKAQRLDPKDKVDVKKIRDIIDTYKKTK